MFECKKCGKCCENPGKIAIFEWEKEELEKEAEKLGIQISISPGIISNFKNLKIVLQWKLDNKKSCFFFDEEKKICKIYEKRPLVCRAYPLAYSGITLPELKEIVGKECIYSKIPFKKNEKIKKEEIVSRLYKEYGEIFIWAFRLDLARIFLVDLLEFYKNDFENYEENYENKNGIEEKEIGIIEFLKKEKLYGEIDEEIEKIYKAGPVGFTET